MSILDTVSALFERVITQAGEFQRTGQHRPAWLQKKMDGLYLSEAEPERGLALLIDGIQDERAATKAAKFRPYHPGEDNG